MYNSNIRKKIAEYFKKKLRMYDYLRGWMKGDCWNCGKHKFGVHIADDRTNCFACGVNKKPIWTMGEIEGFNTFAEIRIFLNTFEGIDYVEPKVKKLEVRNIKLPKEFKLLNHGDSIIAKIARNYMASRGFDVDELSMMGIGYCGLGKYKGYIIFPFFSKGIIIYFIARKFMGSGVKFNNPNEEEFGVGKSTILYNRDALYMYDKIYLVESVINAITLGDKAIASDGKKLSDYQISCIIRSPINKIIIILDPDAWLEAIKLSLKLIDHKKIKLVKLPYGFDVNDIGKEETMKYVNQSKYLNHGDLIKLKLNQCVENHQYIS